MSADIWHEIHLYAIAIYAGWLIICIKIRLRQAEHDAMHQNVCIEDESKRWEMKSSNVSQKVKESMECRTVPFFKPFSMKSN